MTQNTQAVEAAVQRVMPLADKYAKAMTDFTTDHADTFWQERDALLAALRAELARPLEVAQDFDTWQNNPYTKVLQESIARDYVPRYDRPLEVAAPVTNALTTAMAYVRWQAFGECRTPGHGGPPPTAAETDAVLVAALESLTRRVPVAAGGHDEKGRWEQHAEGHWNHYDAQGKLDMQSVPVASVAMIDCDTCGQRVNGPCNSVDCSVPDATVRGGAGGDVGEIPVAEVAAGKLGNRLMWHTLDAQSETPVGTKLYTTPAASVPLGGGEDAAPAVAGEASDDEIMNRVLAYGVLCWNRHTDSAKFLASEIKSMLATPPPLVQPSTGEVDEDAKPGSFHLDRGASCNVQAPTAGPREVARFLRGVRGMGCNCDLDNWEPERSTGHSHVCRIHKAAIAADAALKAEVDAAILASEPATAGRVG